MNKEQVIAWAREAGLIIDANNSGDDDLFAFAAVVSARAAALEREACAELCDGLDDGLVDGLAGWQFGEAIRARGEQALRRLHAAVEQPPLPVQEQQQAQLDVIAVSLMREGINKHKARELADHFVNFTLPPPLPEQRKPLTDEEIARTAAAANIEFDADYSLSDQTIYYIDAASLMGFARAIEAAHGIKEKTND